VAPHSKNGRNVFLNKDGSKMNVTRKQRALAIRDAVLPWFLRNASWANLDCENDETGIREAAIGQFNMSLRSPFTRLPEDVADDYLETALQRHTRSLQYVFDIRVGDENVLNVQWNDATGATQILGFRRGSWEHDIITLDRAPAH
jgi:hypothetical protein